MSYLAVGASDYRLDASGRCVNAMNQPVDTSLCAPQQGFFSSIWNAVTKPSIQTQVQQIPLPASTTKVTFTGSTKSAPPKSLSKSTESWGDKLLKGLDAAGKVASLNRPPAASTSSGTPGWVMPVAIGGGVLVLALALTRK